MLKEWISEYNPCNESEANDAFREIMQEVALAGLSRTNFFEKAAFYGGTALRIFYGLDRFSEDLDFSLLKPEVDFSLDAYFASIIEEFSALGIQVIIKEKNKKVSTSIDSAFLKTQTIWKELVLVDTLFPNEFHHTKAIKIKIEVDRNPPQGFDTEEKLLLRPFSFYVKCFSPSCLFAGKMHALLYRKWNARVKGRDWYDLEWYIKNNIPLNIKHFALRARDTNDFNAEIMSRQDVLELLNAKIEQVSFSRIKEDIVRFVKNENVLNLWSESYFKDLIKQMKFE